MPMHDWTRVEAGIFHAFHHEWISEISRALNRGLLPGNYYALPEQQAAGFGPDILTLQRSREPSGVAGATAVRPQTRVMVETSGEFYVRRKKGVVIRHVSDDRIIAIIEILSPGNRNSTIALRAFVEKVWELLELKIHLLLIDPFPPDKRAPWGIHAALFERFEDEPYRLPEDKPLTLASYECGPLVRGSLEPVAVGDALPPMPLFLEYGAFIDVPMEATYRAAWDTVPRRWQVQIEPGHGS